MYSNTQCTSYSNIRVNDLYVDGTIISPGGGSIISPSQFNFCVADPINGKPTIYGISKSTSPADAHLTIDAGAQYHLDYTDPANNSLKFGAGPTEGSILSAHHSLNVDVVNTDLSPTFESIIIEAQPQIAFPGACITDVILANDGLHLKARDLITANNNSYIDIGSTEIRNDVEASDGFHSYQQIRDRECTIDLPSLLPLGNPAALGGVLLDATVSPFTGQPIVNISSGKVSSTHSNLRIDNDKIEVLSYPLGTPHGLIVEGSDVYLQNLATGTGNSLVRDTITGKVTYHSSPPTTVSLIGLGEHAFTSGGSGNLDYRGMISPLSTIAINPTLTDLEIDITAATPGEIGGMYGNQNQTYMYLSLIHI